MTENESFTIEELEQCTYRYLQSVAKGLKLPCNVKKIHLINMIFAKKYRPESELQIIIKQVKQERLKSSQAKRTLNRSRRNLQGKEISSTSPISPTLQSTSQVIMKCSPQSPTITKVNDLRPLNQSPRRHSERIMRSVTNKQNYKYMINNTVIGLVKSNTVKKAQTQKIAIEKKEQMLKYLLNNFKTGIVNRNSLVKKDFNELTIQKCVQNKPHNTQIVVQTNKRQRTLSGIYPLNPPSDPINQSYINIRGKDGKLTKINAVIQRKNYTNNYDSINQNICVTMQDIINQNITTQVKNKYMLANSQHSTNKDYPNMYSVSETTDKKTFRDIQSVEIIKDTVPDSTKGKNPLNCSVLVHRYNPIEKQYMPNQSSVKTPNKNQYYQLTENIYNTKLQSPVTCCNSRRNQPLNLDKKLQNRLESIINKLPISRPVLSTPELSNLKPEAIPYQVSQPKFNQPMYNRVENTQNLIYNRAENPENVMYNQVENTKNVIYNRAENPENVMYNQVENTKNVMYHQGENTEKVMYNQEQSTENVMYNQAENTQSVCSTNQWVYNQNHYNNAPSYSIDSSGEFYTYYHKKIRARRSVNQREIDDNMNQEILPQINKVFSRFNDIERDLTKPLYVQVSKESERIFNYPMFMDNNHSTHLLETIYNFKNSFITMEPVLKLVTTTSQTNCTYSTPIITTPIAQTSTMVSTDLDASSLPVSTPIYSNNERPCLFDLLKAVEHEDILQNDFRPSRSSSTSSATCSAANITIPEMVDDAMELISQDGDYMERINSDIMDGLIQCFNCSWTGAKNMFVYHLRKDYSLKDILQGKPELQHYKINQWFIRHTLYLFEEHGLEADSGLLVQSLIPDHSTHYPTEWSPHRHLHENHI